MFRGKFLLLPAAGFLDRLRIELRLQGQLQGLGLKPGLVQQLLKQRSTSNAEVNELRLDLSPMKQASVLVTRAQPPTHHTVQERQRIMLSTLLMVLADLAGKCQKTSFIDQHQCQSQLLPVLLSAPYSVQRSRAARLQAACVAGSCLQALAG